MTLAKEFPEGMKNRLWRKIGLLTTHAHWWSTGEVRPFSNTSVNYFTPTVSICIRPSFSGDTRLER
jgi:hypothetical protein